MIKILTLTEIVTDAGTQVRAGINEATVEDYAAAMAAGEDFPPPIVFHDGTRYLAADGFHRVMACSRNGEKQIKCEVRKGSRTDALKFALSSNAYHGLRRTNADKRHAVELAVKEFDKFSDSALAKMCAVNRELVAEVRKADLLDSSRSAIPQVPQSRIGLDGVERRLPPPPMFQGGGNKIPDPPPNVMIDGTGIPIPTQLIPLWRRTEEIQDFLSALSEIKGGLRTAQKKKDILFAEVNFSSVFSHIEQAWTDIKTAKPFAVCPICQGQLPDKCLLCRGRGLISEHRWNTCVTSEDKQFRKKQTSRKV